MSAGCGGAACVSPPKGAAGVSALFVALAHVGCATCSISQRTPTQPPSLFLASPGTGEPGTFNENFCADAGGSYSIGSVLGNTLGEILIFNWCSNGNLMLSFFGNSPFRMNWNDISSLLFCVQMKASQLDLFNCQIRNTLFNHKYVTANCNLALISMNVLRTHFEMISKYVCYF